jgi:hypothetical protein
VAVVAVLLVDHPKKVYPVRVGSFEEIVTEIEDLLLVKISVSGAPTPPLAS